MRMIPPFLRLLAGAATLVLLAGCGGAASPGANPAGPASAAGAPPADPAGASVAEATSVQDGVYTEVQAGRGRDVFRAVCAECHESLEFRGDRFLLSWEGTTVGRFVDRLMSTMPDGAPNSLPTGQYVDVTAYILQLNGFPAGAAELTDRLRALEAIRIERGGEAGR
jgi:hypothetical protein